LSENGLICLKTDNTAFYEYTLEVCRSGDFEIKELVFTDDLYASPLAVEHFGITTRYEKIWSEKGEKIKYLRFRLGKKAPELPQDE
jgi:tRNA (guanine-N7-)-methyltransferase